MIKIFQDDCQRCSIVFGSFDNAAVQMIEYNITKMEFPRRSENSKSEITYFTERHSILSSNGQKLSRVLITIVQNITTIT